eukprot:scaffold96850_cov40-Phaeocystis_antarctica.AAC.3
MPTLTTDHAPPSSCAGAVHAGDDDPNVPDTRTQLPRLRLRPKCEPSFIVSIAQLPRLRLRPEYESSFIVSIAQLPRLRLRPKCEPSFI